MARGHHSDVQSDEVKDQENLIHCDNLHGKQMKNYRCPMKSDRFYFRKKERSFIGMLFLNSEYGGEWKRSQALSASLGSLNSVCLSLVLAFTQPVIQKWKMFSF